MNGRVYSPETGRFLSPDPLIQAPTYSQSFNRYSYVWNNPLNLIDPSGYAADNSGPTTANCDAACKEKKEKKEKEKEKERQKIKGKIVAVTKVCSGGQCKVVVTVVVSGTELSKLKGLLPEGKGKNKKSGETLNNAIDEVFDEHEKSKINDCADYCIAVAKKLGISGSGDLDPDTVNADALIGWAKKNGTEIKDMKKAQSLAASGEFIIAGSTSKELGEKHGHVSVVRSGDLVPSGKLDKSVPRVGNRSIRGGRSNFKDKGLNWAFPAMPKLYHIPSN